MKRLLIILILSSGWCLAARAQSAQSYFDAGANHYVNNRMDDALKQVNSGLQKFPSDRKLQELSKKLNEQKKQQDQQRDQQQKEQEQKDQQQKDQQQKDQQQKDQQQKDQQQKDQQQKEQQQKDQQQKDAKEKDGKEQEQQQQDQKNQKQQNSPQLSEKLEQMRISEEKARMILEAMKNQELQYLQQQKRKSEKPKDRNKPDW